MKSFAFILYIFLILLLFRDNNVRVKSKLDTQQTPEMLNNSSYTVQSATIGGYQGGRKTRCTDKFVRYPYPKTLSSGY